MAQLSGLIYVAVCVQWLSAILAAPTNTDMNSCTKGNSTKKIAQVSHQAVSDALMLPNDYYTITAQNSQESEYQPISPFNTYQHTPATQTQTDFQNPNIYGSKYSNSQNFYGSLFPETFSFDQFGPSFGQNFPYSPAIPNYAAPLPKVNSNPTSQPPLANHHNPLLNPHFPYSPDIPTYAAPLPKFNSIPPSPPPKENLNTELLGSGNFGVIRGGTFYTDDELPLHSADGSETSDYLSDASNSHDEAHATKVDFIDTYTYPEEQFEHFRDFAELGSSIDGAFSHFSSKHAKKNTSKLHQKFQPKNIFEQLEEIDREKTLAAKLKKSQTTSKTKAKLAKTKLEKKIKTKFAAKNAENDPLLALS